MANLDSLLVTIDASTELLRKELAKGDASVQGFANRTDSHLSKLDKRFSQFGSALKSTFAAFGVGLSVSALVSFGRNAIQTADAIGEAAKAADIGAERFQRLRFVFGQNGVSATEFDAAMRKLNQGLGAFITTGGGPAAVAIKRLGLEQDIANGKIRTAEQFYDAVVRSLAGVSSAAERASISAALFGREAGSKMATTLSTGTEALKKSEEAAKGVFSDEQVAKADALNDAYDRVAKTVGNTLKGAFIDAAAAMAGLDPTKLGSIEQRIKAIDAQIARVNAEPSLEELGGGSNITGAALEAPTQETKDRELRDLRHRRALLRSEQEDAEAEEEAKREAARKRAAQEAILDQGVGGVTVANQLRQLPGMGGGGRQVTDKEREGVARDLASLQEQALRAQGRMADAIRLAADEQIAAWQRVATETPEFADEAAQAIVLINERASADIKEIADKVKPQFAEFAQSLGGALQDTLASAFMGVETDFRGLLKRLASQLAASALLKGIGSLFGAATGTGFFASLVKGFASGGRPPMGRASMVGENGPELWVPDMPGQILSNAQSRMAMAGGRGGGVTIAPVYNIDARGATTDLVRALPGILAANNKTLKAELRETNKRGRF